jgi:8-oxo-dGTP pyrophosphatase MutT (NUDIX family)
MNRNGPKPWRVLDEEHLQHCKVFDVHRATMESPQTGDRHPFYRIESPAWVNVVALTPDETLVMVRQFRQGSRLVTLEIPGGIVDPGETPAEAAARELLEETGYRAGRLESLGSINPNPALFGNRCHFELALDCTPEAEIQNSATEETALALLPLSELHDTLRAGGIDHALVVAALYAFELWRSRST